LSLSLSLSLADMSGWKSEQGGWNLIYES